MTGSAPEHICALLRQGCAGRVEMVNSRGIYLQLESRHILLCHSRFGTVPNGISLEQWTRLPALLAADQQVRVETGVVYTPSAELHLHLRSVPRHTQILSPNETGFRAGLKLLLSQAKQTGLSALVYPLFTGQTTPGNLYCELALPHTAALRQALREENTDRIYRSVCALLGLGPGLTPSGDDLLSGLLYGLRHSPARNTTSCEALRDAILDAAHERTNAVSADYLIALAQDAPFDCMAAAWEDPAGKAAELLQIGHNSGSEMLLGLLCAMAHCLPGF